MNIKTEVRQTSKKKTGRYPWIGINNAKDLIVLFSKKCSGTVISSGSTIYREGQYDTDWNESTFEIFNGTITYEQTS